MKKLVVVIPSYEPDNKLIELIDDLNKSLNNFNIIVVNDGSVGYDDIFNKLKEFNNVTLLNHDRNYGKGKALKTAFEYIKGLNEEMIIVTADSDGQHSPEDIKRVYNFYLKNEGSIVLGSRRFGSNTPKKSLIGNNIYRHLVRMNLNKHLNDTQTGLRAFDTSLIDFMLNIRGNKFEYEMNMIDEAIVNDIDIHELEIKTIYIDGNKGTHFRPTKDFARIVSSIIDYKLVTLMFLIIDMLLFTILNKKTNLGTNHLIYSSLISSAISFVLLSIFNIFFNVATYKNKSRLIKYILLNLIIIGANLGITLAFSKLMNSYLLIRFLSNIIILVIDLLFNYFVLKKSKLNKE